MAKTKTKKAEKTEPEPSVETEEVTQVTEVIPETEPQTEPEQAKKQNDLVTVTVVKGSVTAMFLGSKQFKKGDVFQTSRANALRIDPNFIVIQDA